MSTDNDPDLELVRKLHLELNGSGRRTRGTIPPPAKRLKREGSRPLSSHKDTPSLSGSGSGSGSARVVRREGVLKRLVKKQPDSDSDHHNATAEDDGVTVEAAANDSLEPQASTKALEGKKQGALLRDDVGSRVGGDFTDPEAIRAAAVHAAKLARAAAARDAANALPRVKCFYQGYPYGLSFGERALASRKSLADALKTALAAEDIPICAAEELEIMTLDTEGKQKQCKPDEGAGCWHAAVSAAKRVYIVSSSSLHIV